MLFIRAQKIQRKKKNAHKPCQPHEIRGKMNKKPTTKAQMKSTERSTCSAVSIATAAKRNVTIRMAAAIQLDNCEAIPIRFTHSSLDTFIRTFDNAIETLLKNGTE